MSLDPHVAPKTDSDPSAFSPALLHHEGQATFQVGSAFYRPQSRMARDLGILAAAHDRQTKGHLRVLDAMSGCGVRSLRYAWESGADWVWVNEGNPDLADLLRQNLQGAIDSNRATLTHWDANRVFFDCYTRRDYYDVVDVDAFGSAAPYLSTSLWSVAIGGLLYLTSADGRTMAGHPPDQGLSAYGAYVRHHPATQEQGLRLLIGAVQQQAAHRGRGIEPVFSFYQGQTYRILVRLRSKPNLSPHNYGFLGYCHHCGNYQTIPWQHLGRSLCPQDDRFLSVSGPLWLGSLHSATILRSLRALAENWGWDAAATLLTQMIEEAPLPPYFFPLGEIGRRGQLDIPPRSPFIQALHQAGYPAVVPHSHPQAIKTTASLQTCIALARSMAIGEV